MEYKLEQIDPAKLVPLKENPRNHPEELIGKIEKSMSKFGFVAPIIALKGSNEIIAGHGRHKTATKMKMKKVPVIFIEMDRQEGIEYAIADNKLQEDSSWDFMKLNEIFSDDNTDLEVTGFNDAEIKRVMEKFSIDLEFIEGTNFEEEKIPVNENIPTANIKMLQLFFTQEDYIEVTNQCHRLMSEYKVESITDVIKVAVDNEHSKCK